jgi:hypothetical protein
MLAGLGTYDLAYFRHLPGNGRRSAALARPRPGMYGTA